MSWFGAHHEPGLTKRVLLLSWLAVSCLGCDTKVELGSRRLIDASLSDARSANVDGRTAQSDADVDDNEDSDDQNEEGHTDPPRPCTDTAQCAGEEPFCSVARGFCVECLRDEHCTKPNERCEADGECDGPE
jgi:hypothetical protein